MTKKTDFTAGAYYHTRFKDSAFVIKAGGRLIADDAARNNLIKNIRDLTLAGIRILLIYGGGEPVDLELKRRNIEIAKHNGRRITDKATLDVMKQVLAGDLALRVYESAAAINLDLLNLTAVPPDWMKVALRPKTPVDFGYVGDIAQAYKRPVDRLLRNSNFIAAPCLAWAADGTLCNINADTVATELAIGLKASKLIMLSDVDGLLADGKTVSIITDKDIPALIEKGVAKDGMRVKLETCGRALQAGVNRIHLLNGFQKDALAREVFEPAGHGTMILKESEKTHYQNELALKKA